MTQYNVGDTVKFNGIDTNAKDRKDQQIDGSQGDWPNLKVGAIGTINWVEQDDEGRNNPRLFVDFPECPCVMDSFSEFLGMPKGWPVLTSEVERIEVAA